MRSIADFLGAVAFIGWMFWVVYFVMIAFAAPSQADEYKLGEWFVILAVATVAALVARRLSVREGTT